MTTQSETDLPREESSAIDRREAIRRVTAMLGGLTLVGGSSLVAACQRERRPGPRVPIGEFTVADIDLLDEVADTILPETKTPGAKAANVGAFMALMVTDTYKPEDRQVFRDGMRSLDALCFQSNKAAFVAAKPEQRLALLEKIDREAKTYMDLRSEARKAREKSDTTAQTNASPRPADPLLGGQHARPRTAGMRRRSIRPRQPRPGRIYPAEPSVATRARIVVSRNRVPPRCGPGGIFSVDRAPSAHRAPRGARPGRR